MPNTKKKTTDAENGTLPAGAYRYADLTEAQRATLERMFERSERRLKAAEAARAANPEQVMTPYGRLTLGCYNVEEMDRESRETVVRGLKATIARMDAEGANSPARKKRTKKGDGVKR